MVSNVVDFSTVSGQERYALLIGNVYGVPTAGRVFGKERDRIILEAMPKAKGWRAWQCTYDPCIYIIETGEGDGTPDFIPSTKGVWCLHAHENVSLLDNPVRSSFKSELNSPDDGCCVRVAT